MTDTVRIDPETCTGCGLCAELCPSDILSLREGKMAATGEGCIGCAHCAAVCPTGAVTVPGLSPGDFATFTAGEDWLPYGGMEPARFAALALSRRSCRAFTPDPVKRDQLEDLVRFAVTAPSGTNSQVWTFTLLPDREAVLRLGKGVAAYFRRLNRQAENPLLRHGLKLLGKTELDRYYREYYPRVRDALDTYEATGRDRLFHGAPAAIVVGSAPGGSCPAEDALLATENLLLGAHCMGLGTCLIGYAVSAMVRDPAIRRGLGIPPEESVHAVIALGHPAVRFRGLTGRRRPVIRYA